MKVLDRDTVDMDDMIDDEVHQRHHAPRRVRMVELSKITIPIEYQRRFDQKRAETIAAEFNEESCNVLTVALRTNGDLVATEGQHRLWALKELGYKFWPCWVVEGKTLAQEAGIWVNMNVRRKQPTSPDTWKARRTEQDPIVLAIEDIIHDLGLEINEENSKAWNVIRASSAVERIYRGVGRRALVTTLRTVMEAWPQQADAFRGPVLLGVASFLTYYKDDREFNHSELSTKLAAVPIRKLLQRGTELAGIGGGSGAGSGGKTTLAWAPGMVKAIVGVYNHRRSKHMLEDPTVRGWKAVTAREIARHNKTPYAP